MPIKGSNIMAVQENLKQSFAGESQAYVKYTAFAKKAERDKLPGVARLFRAAAAAEFVHATAQLNVMGGIQNTAENLKVAKGGEEYEYNSMYPLFIENAKKEANIRAEQIFTGAMEAEKLHAALYQRAIDAVEKGKDLEIEKLYVCPVCGYTVEEKPDKCPVCGVTRFDEIV
jgi:rubrerythrin